MAGGAAPKVEEPQAHPPKDQLPNVSYCITSPPPWRECLFFAYFFFPVQNSVPFSEHWSCFTQDDRCACSILLNLGSFSMVSYF